MAYACPWRTIVRRVLACPAGQPMPSIATLAQEYRVKPEMAAKALKALEDFGLVYAGPPGPEYARYYVGDKHLPPG